jgi:anti-sigma factor RsiW
MSSRPITEDDLHAYVDDVLESARQAEIALYLEGHPDVALRVEEYRRQREELRAAFAPVAEEPLPPELTLAHLIERRRTPARRPALRWGVQVAAAVLLLLAGGAGGWSLRTVETGPAAPAVREALASGGIASLAQEASYNYAVFAGDHQRLVELRAENIVEF